MQVVALQTRRRTEQVVVQRVPLRARVPPALVDPLREQRIRGSHPLEAVDCERIVLHIRGVHVSPLECGCEHHVADVLHDRRLFALPHVQLLDKRANVLRELAKIKEHLRDERLERRAL